MKSILKYFLFICVKVNFVIFWMLSWAVNCISNMLLSLLDNLYKSLPKIEEVFSWFVRSPESLRWPIAICLCQSSFVLSHSSLLNFWTFLASFLEPLNQFQSNLAYSIKGWRGVKIWSLWPLPFFGIRDGAKTIKMNAISKKSSLLLDIKYSNCWHWALYENCEIHGPMVRGLGPQAKPVWP